MCDIDISIRATVTVDLFFKNRAINFKTIPVGKATLQSPENMLEELGQKPLTNEGNTAMWSVAAE